MKGTMLTATLVTMTALACASATGPESDDSILFPEIPASATEITTEEVFTRPFSPITDRRRMVIESESGWSDFWTEINGDIVPLPALPDVDFSRYAVLVAAMGERPTGGYSIGIPMVKREGDDVFAVVRSISPGPTCVTTQVLTAPVTATRVPRIEGSVHWIEDNAPLEC